MQPYSLKRGFYFYFMQFLFRTNPSRNLRKTFFYWSYLGSFKRLWEIYSIKRNYRRLVSDYRQQQKKRKAKLVVYSCITSNYDPPMQLKFINPDFDYVFFVENPEAYAPEDYPWDFRPLAFAELDKVRNARWHKIIGQQLFPEYEETLWIDSNIDILSPLLYSDLQKIRASGAPMAVAMHTRKCSYLEAQECMKRRKDDPALIQKEYDLMKSEGFPENYGMYETHILYRRNNNPEIKTAMQTWWQMVKDFSRRDQVSFVYSLWKNGLPLPPELNPLRYRYLYGDILTTRHTQKKKFLFFFEPREKN